MQLLNIKTEKTEKSRKSGNFGSWDHGDMDFPRPEDSRPWPRWRGRGRELELSLANPSQVQSDFLPDLCCLLPAMTNVHNPNLIV